MLVLRIALFLAIVLVVVVICIPQGVYRWVSEIIFGKRTA